MAKKREVGDSTLSILLMLVVGLPLFFWILVPMTGAPQETVRGLTYRVSGYGEATISHVVGGDTEDVTAKLGTWQRSVTFARTGGPELKARLSGDGGVLVCEILDGADVVAYQRAVGRWASCSVEAK